MIEAIRLYLKWCWQTRSVLPWCVSLVSDRELTREEYDFPGTSRGKAMLQDGLEELGISPDELISHNED
jgi:hypothetical protein